MTDTAHEVVEWARRELNVERPWTVVGSRRKFGKTLVEFEDDGRRYIARASKTQAEVDTFELMKRVWDAGMRPPSPYRIVEPVAWLPERLLLIQSKAEGTPVLQFVKERDPRAMQAMEQAGAWLHTMQSLRVELPVAPGLTGMLDRCERELNDPRASVVLEKIRGHLHAELTVPSHGDFHPQNLYWTGERMTAIDLDTLAMREPAFDVAWLLSQLAIMGHRALGSFEATAELRKRFRRCAPAVPDERVELHIRFGLIRSLHYDFCILRLKDRSHREAFLQAAERGGL